MAASNGIKVTALTPVLTFTEDDILPGSFQKEYIDADQRRAVNISLVWREADPLTIGIQRTTTVRYPGTDANAPTQQYDMTDFCTSAAHATTYGKYELARRKYSVHTISFSTALLTTSLIPTQIIKVQRQRINSRGDNRTEIEWYQVTNVKHSSAGVSSISASQFPVNGSDIARISNEVVNGTFEVI
jgi:predicted phage tail protein